MCTTYSSELRSFAVPQQWYSPLLPGGRSRVMPLSLRLLRQILPNLSRQIAIVTASDALDVISRHAFGSDR